MCSRQFRRGEYVGILNKAGLEPIGLWSTMSTKSIGEIARGIVVARDEANRHDCNGMTDCPLRSTFFALEKEVDRLVTGTRGLCLDCVNAKHETTGLNMHHPDKPECRMGHGEGVAKI